MSDVRWLYKTGLLLKGRIEGRGVDQPSVIHAGGHTLTYDTWQRMGYKISEDPR